MQPFVSVGMKIMNNGDAASVSAFVAQEIFPTNLLRSSTVALPVAP